MRKTIKLFTCQVICVMIGAAVLLNSCRNDVDDGHGAQDYEYLDFSHDVTSADFLSEEDAATVAAAWQRCDVITTDEGLLYLNTSSCRDVNLSERLFNYIYEAIEGGNEMLIEKGILLAPMTKSGPESGGGGLQPGRDCMACCIGWVGEHRGYGSYSSLYNSAASYIYNNYGQGVPYSGVGQTLGYVFGNNVSATGNSYSYSRGSTILILSGHAVVYQYHLNGNTYMVKDPQTGSSYPVSSSQVRYAYTIR